MADEAFHVSPDYVMRQLKFENARLHEQLTLQSAGFDQMQDMHAERVDQIGSLEETVQRLRAEMGEHERFAVEQQTLINEFNVFKKALVTHGFDPDKFINELVGGKLFMPIGHTTEGGEVYIKPVRDQGATDTFKGDEKIWADDPASE